MSEQVERGLLPSDLQVAVLGGDVEALNRAQGKFGLPQMRTIFTSAEMTVDGGFTPLHMACMRTGDTEAMVRKLLEVGVTLEGQTGSGATALSFACSRLQLGAVRALLEAGANTNAADKNGYTPLMYAIGSKLQEKGSDELRQELVRLLAGHGARIEQPDIRGRRAAHHAAQNNNEACFMLLRDLGADIYAQDNDGKLPLDLGAQNWARGLKARLMSEHVMAAMGDGEEDAAPAPKSSGFTL